MLAQTSISPATLMGATLVDGGATSTCLDGIGEIEYLAALGLYTVALVFAGLG